MVTTQMAEILDTSFREWRTGSGCRSRSRRGSRRRIFLFIVRGSSGGGIVVVVFLFSGICAYGRRAVATCRRHFREISRFLDQMNPFLDVKTNSPLYIA
jgi:hypothetical protein